MSAIDHRAQELSAELPLPAQDWKAIIIQVESLRPAVQALDELPLENVEPAGTFRVSDEHSEGERS